MKRTLFALMLTTAFSLHSMEKPQLLAEESYTSKWQAEPLKSYKALSTYQKNFSFLMFSSNLVEMCKMTAPICSHSASLAFQLSNLPPQMFTQNLRKLRDYANTVHYTSIALYNYANSYVYEKGSSPSFGDALPLDKLIQLAKLSLDILLEHYQEHIDTLNKLAHNNK